MVLNILKYFKNILQYFNIELKFLKEFKFNINIINIQTVSK